jgi:hypothetical protein
LTFAPLRALSPLRRRSSWLLSHSRRD